MTAQPARSECRSPETASALVAAVPSFKPSLVKAVFRDVTPMHVSRSAAWAAGSVTRTVLAEIIEGARRAAAEEARRKLVPADLVAAIDRNVDVEVGTAWYEHSPTFRELTGVAYDAEGVVGPARGRGGARRPSAVAGAHRFEAGVRRLLRGQGVAAVPALVRDLNGIASVFLTDLARDAAMVVREGRVRRFGSVALVIPGEPAAPAPLDASVPSRSSRTGDSRTVGRDDVLAAATIQLFGANLRQRALAEALGATRNVTVLPAR
ncbi:hypothetical protein ACFWIN_34665 [Streptomyces sp. NPDC127049]|uniref:hypothetical protein n=1 Tax=Streptomyces sp. NPDC127049 TaxID=3347118 RepID=UPI00365855E5